MTRWWPGGVAPASGARPWSPVARSDGSDGNDGDHLRARVIVLAGPSGCGKSRLAEHSGLPVVALDDFYRDGHDPGMPRIGGPDGPVDWEDPRSWDHDAAVAALVELCRTGRVEVPIYCFAADGRTGTHTISLDGADRVIAEGIFAAEVVDACREAGILADAVLVRVPPLVNFWRRSVRDQREGRKPPLVLLHQGWAKLRDERRVVARQAALGCRPMSKAAARALLGVAPRPAPSPATPAASPSPAT